MASPTNHAVHRRLQRWRGFSAIELIAVLGLIGLIAAIGVPIMRGVKVAADDKAAISCATAIDAAKMSYRDKVQMAANTWTGLSNDAKYLALKNTNCLPMAPATLTAFMPKGYTIAIGNLLDQSTVTATTRKTTIYPPPK